MRRLSVAEIQRPRKVLTWWEPALDGMASRMMKPMEMFHVNQIKLFDRDNLCKLSQTNCVLKIPIFEYKFINNIVKTNLNICL